MPFKFLLLTLIIVFLLATVSANYVPADFNLEGITGNPQIIAVGDWDGDLHNDLFLLRTATNITDPTQTVYYIDLWVWESGLDGYENDVAKTATFHNQSISSHLPITNILLVDFNNDGKLDILLTGPDDTDSVYYAKIYLTNTNKDFVVVPQYISPPPLSQVSVLDGNGDGTPDLFGSSMDAVTLKPIRTVWIITTNKGTNDLLFSPRYLPITSFAPGDAFYNTAGFPYLAYGYAPVIGDVNGDCGGDLILVTTSEQDQVTSFGSKTTISDPTKPPAFDEKKQIEIWTLDRATSAETGFIYTLKYTYPAPLGLLQPVAADYNNDGALDIAVPTCIPDFTSKTGPVDFFPGMCQKGDISKISIYYNIQKGMCKSITSTANCRSASNLCIRDDAFYFDFPQMANIAQFLTQSEKLAILSLTLDKNEEYFYTSNHNNPISPTNPIFLAKMGDLNMDGNIDIIIPVISVDSGSKFYMPLKMVGCDSIKCSEWQKNNDLFALVESNVEITQKFSMLTTDMIALAMLDIRNDGDLDFIGMKAIFDQQTKQIKHIQLQPLSNKFHGDGYFLTLHSSNGVCHTWSCGNGLSNKKPYGPSYHSATFKWTVTNLMGTKTPRIATQNAITAYSPLQAPHLTVGLGRTSNYIEELFMGIPTSRERGGSQFSQAFGSIIPNSQIVIFPFPINSPDNWTMELFMLPTEHLFWVFIAWIVTTAACMMVIAALHIQETVEQNRLKRHQQRLFAF